MLCNNVDVRRCLYFELGCFYLLIFYFETDFELESAVCRSPYERDSIDRLACQVVSSLVLFESCAAILDHVKSSVKLSEGRFLVEEGGGVRTILQIALPPPPSKKKKTKLKLKIWLRCKPYSFFLHIK